MLLIFTPIFNVKTLSPSFTVTNINAAIFSQLCVFGFICWNFRLKANFSSKRAALQRENDDGFQDSDDVPPLI